jgi:hypothetical protein
MSSSDEFGLVLGPASPERAIDWIALAQQVGADTSGMTPPHIAFWFENERERDAAEDVLSSTAWRDRVVYERHSAKFSRLAQMPEFPHRREQQPRAKPQREPVATVYGESAHQRLPMCLRSSVPTAWQFEPFVISTTELKKEGIDTSALGSAQLSLMPGSVCVGVSVVDDATARLVCDWIVDEPRVAAVIERLLWQRAYEAYAPEAITWDGVKLVAHSCLSASTEQMQNRDGWFTAEVWLGEVPTDSSAMSIAGVVHRAVTSLVGVNASDVFALTTSRTLPFIKIQQLAPPAFVKMLDDQSNPLYKQMVHEDDRPSSKWPSAVTKQLEVLAEMPTEASFCWPREADAVLFFGLRASKSNDDKCAARALAIATSVARRLPKQDLPTLEDAWSEMLTNVETDKSSDAWICAILSEQALTAIDVQTLVATVAASSNLQVVDLCEATSVTARDVFDLLAIPHVRVVAIAGVEGAEEIAKQCEGQLKRKLVWIAFERVWSCGLTREQIDRHLAFFAFQCQAKVAWRHQPC